MIENFSLREWGSSLLDLFLPRTCIICGCVLGIQEKSICARCLADMPRTAFSKMRSNQMSERFNNLLQTRTGIRSGREKFVYASALFFYRPGSDFRKITHRLKYHSDMATGRYFSRMLGRELVSSCLFSDVDSVIPVPLHWTRRWKRGYNQAEVIAREVASMLGAPVLPKVLKRVRRTGTQTKMSIEEKAANVEGAFIVRPGVDFSKMKHVLLVDDVFTTGSTLFSCYLAIRKKAGDKLRISIATLACVGR